MKNLKLFNIVIIFLNLNCYLHHANVSGDLYGAKKIVSLRNTDSISSLPIKLEFDKSNIKVNKEFLYKKGQNKNTAEEEKEFDSDLMNNYYSDEIFSQFQASKLFYLNRDSDIKIRIDPSLDEVKQPVLSLIPNFFSLGLFPRITRTTGKVNFEIFSVKENKILKVFKYKVNHRIFLSLPSVFLGPILPSFSERFDHSQNNKTFAIMRVAFGQFEEELAETLKQDKTLLAKFSASEPSVYALIPAKTSSPKLNEFSNALYQELESGFLARGMKLAERKNLDKILDEVKFSLSGLTESSRNRVGQLVNVDKLIVITDLEEDKTINKIKFQIRSFDVVTGKTLWSYPCEFEAHRKISSQNIQSSISETLQTLRNLGEI